MRAPAIPAVLACLALLVAGCGGEREFDADELIEELNANGAALELGDPLVSEGEGLEIYAVSVGEGEEGGAEPDAAEEGAGEEEHGHGGGGSLRIADDGDAGFAEYERCEAAASLLCFRASNAVLVLEDDLPAADRARVESALSALATD